MTILVDWASKPQHNTIHWDRDTPICAIYNMVMALGCQKFVSAQYLVNELMEFDQISHMH